MAFTHSDDQFETFDEGMRFSRSASKVCSQMNNRSLPDNKRLQGVVVFHFATPVQMQAWKGGKQICRKSKHKLFATAGLAILRHIKGQMNNIEASPSVFNYYPLLRGSHYRSDPECQTTISPRFFSNSLANTATEVEVYCVFSLIV